MTNTHGMLERFRIKLSQSGHNGASGFFLTSPSIKDTLFAKICANNFFVTGKDKPNCKLITRINPQSQYV